MTEPDPRLAARRLTELAHACTSFADTLALDRAMEPEQLVLRDLAGRARVLSMRRHEPADAVALADQVPHLVEPDHRATHSRYGHHQLRLDRAADALRTS